jgi:hypothetical protein
MFSRLSHWLQPLFLSLAVVVIAWLLYTQWETLVAYPWHFAPIWLAATVALLGLTWAVEVEIWRRLLAQVGGRLGYLAAVRVWFLSAVLRYIPGNIWQPLSLVVYCRRYGIAPEATFTSIAIYQVVLLLAATPMAVAYLALRGPAPAVARLTAGIPPWLYLLLLAPVVALVLRPGWMLAMLNRLLVRMGRPPLEVRLSSLGLAGLVLAQVVNWLMWGATYAAFTFGVTGLDFAEQAELAGLMVVAYPVAYTIGFLSFISPSGFGVREGALYLLLVPRLEGAIIAVIALAFRLFTTCGELLVALLSAPFESAPRAQHAGLTGANPTPVEHASGVELPRTAV